eukprot:6041710-Amphidinium_carterae.1
MVRGVQREATSSRLSSASETCRLESPWPLLQMADSGRPNRWVSSFSAAADHCNHCCQREAHSEREWCKG